MINSQVMSRLCLVAGLCSLFFLSAISSAASDDEKIVELQRALMSPPDQELPAKKPGTRAIVFDNAPAADASAPHKSTGTTDCSSLPIEIKTTSIDFAIQFRVNSAEIAHSSESVLNQIAKVLALSPDRCVLVEGHTDTSGNPESNMALSRDRAASVVQFIVQRSDMDARRFVPVGKGSTDPLKNLEPRSPMNRRVVFKVVG